MKDASEALPLTPLTYHILLALADHDRHGYSIIKEVELRTGQSMQIETGALYHAIRRMRNEELIEPAPANESESAVNSRRRTYRLTKWGRSVLAAESARLRQLVDIAEAKHVLQARTT
ncbi:MAG: helix-turn-helix transcriptional regulator [Gemmatimonadota bacterium]|nr:MAG: helix-turn-helix transcriptional regulator [Gemmatimonadota bacterium]